MALSLGNNLLNMLKKPAMQNDDNNINAGANNFMTQMQNTSIFAANAIPQKDDFDMDKMNNSFATNSIFGQQKQMPQQAQNNADQQMSVNGMNIEDALAQLKAKKGIM